MADFPVRGTLKEIFSRMFKLLSYNETGLRTGLSCSKKALYFPYSKSSETGSVLVLLSDIALCEETH